MYKAKRLDNGEWVEGNLLFSEDADEDFRTIIIPTKGSNMYTDITEIDLGIECWFKVDPETVCQYTGLTDKNGKKIFEGDIISGLFLHGIEVKSICKFDGGSFGAEWNRGDVKEFNPFTSCCNVEREVIGNIFDNS